VNKTEAAHIAISAAVNKARFSLYDFTTWTMPAFEDTWFHRSFYKQLQRFADGEVTKMMVWIPPQTGKTEGATRRMTAYLLGVNPRLKVAIVSYNSPMARKFNREIQRIIDMPEYKEVFPDTRLNEKNVVTVHGSWLRNADECEVVKHGGGFKTVGVGGPLTGSKVDVLIIDDVYKDAQDVWSTTVRSNIADWYDTVAETRLHNNSRQLVVFTRWHEDDLAGRIVKTHPKGWEIVKYEAIKTGDPTDIDPRQPGEALWPERHSAEKLMAAREKNAYAFEALYQQNPSPKGGNYIRGEWFVIKDQATFPDMVYDMWIDGAYTKSTKNDPTGIMVCGTHAGKLYVKTFIEAYMEMPELLSTVRAVASANGINAKSRVYVEPKASGKTLVQMLGNSGLNMVEIKSKLVSDGKEARIHTAAPTINGGGVVLAQGAWNSVFIHQLEAFPGAKHDEAVDLLGYAIGHYFVSPQPTDINNLQGVFY